MTAASASDSTRFLSNGLKHMNDAPWHIFFATIINNHLDQVQSWEDTIKQVRQQH